MLIVRLALPGSDEPRFGQILSDGEDAVVELLSVLKSDERVERLSA